MWPPSYLPGQVATWAHIPTTDATSDESIPRHDPGSLDYPGSLSKHGDRSVGDSPTVYVLRIPPSVPALLSSESLRNLVVLLFQTMISALS